MVVSSQAIDLAHAAADHLRLLYPDAAGAVQLTFETGESGLIIAAAELESLAEEPPPDVLVDATELRRALLLEAVEQLLRALGVPEERATAFELKVWPERLSVLGFEIAIDEQRLMYGAAFMAALRASADAAMRRQEELQAAMAALGMRRVSWDREGGSLYLVAADEAEVARVPADLLGTFAEAGSWWWAWADDELDPAHVAASRVLRERGASAGLAVLGAPQFPCTAPFALTLAQLGAAELGERAFWRWQQGGVQRFFAVDPNDVVAIAGDSRRE